MLGLRGHLIKKTVLICCVHMVVECRTKVNV